MVRHHGVHDIFGASLGHMASDAVSVFRMIGRIDNRVALAADAIVMFGGGWAMRNVVGVVTRGALQRALAFEETPRFAKTVCGADDLEFVLPAGRGRVIEDEHESRERLARAERIRSAIETAYGVGKREAGGFEMALRAHLHAAIRWEPRRIHDCFPEVLQFRIGQLSGLHVISTGAVAALTIDSFGQRE